MAANAKVTEERPRKERAENAAKRRRQIVDATIASIEKNGLAATTLATVAQAAGLSQGVAVFYFKNKQALLAETLRRVYQEYETTWQTALSKAGDEPLAGILALVSADFDRSVCNRRTLAIWHAFWGESTARPIFAEISTSFDGERAACMRELCTKAAPGMVGGWDPVVVADSVDSLTDGFWHRIYLAGGVGFDRETALDMTLQFIASVFPSRRDEILQASPKTSRTKTSRTRDLTSQDLTDQREEHRCRTANCSTTTPTSPSSSSSGATATCRPAAPTRCAASSRGST